MAMNKTQVVAASKAAIKTAMATAYSESEATYDEFAGIMADSIVDIIIQHILDNAETDPSGEGIL